MAPQVYLETPLEGLNLKMGNISQEERIHVQFSGFIGCTFHDAEYKFCTHKHK